MVVFDLDDTLVPTAQQIPAAVSALRAFMERHMPGTHRLSSQDMSQLMRKLVAFYCTSPIISCSHATSPVISLCTIVFSGAVHITLCLCLSAMMFVVCG